MNNLDTNNDMAPVNHRNPGHYNDPDMLQVGNVGLLHNEQVSHFALWCLITGPLLISTDLNTITNASLAILTHEEMIAVNQDPSGIQGVRVSDYAPTGGEVWAKNLSSGGGSGGGGGGGSGGGSIAVIFLNRGSTAMDITAAWSTLRLQPTTSVSVRDIWNRREVATNVVGTWTARAVQPHSVVVVKLTPT